MAVAVPTFVANQRFGETDGDRWRDYTAWAKIPNLKEVVSLDTLLCPIILPDLLDQDWNHNVKDDYRLNEFYDLPYLLKRTAAIPRRNILGLYRNPSRHITTPPANVPFTFLGYELIEQTTSISALTNCGGFPESFANSELNEYGLLPTFPRASEIQRLLPLNNPDEPHADCELYAIWRLTEHP